MKTLQILATVAQVLFGVIIAMLGFINIMNGDFENGMERIGISFAVLSTARIEMSLEKK